MTPVSCFQPEYFYGAGSGPLMITAADVDGDGDPDLAACSTESRDVTVLRNLSR